MSLHTLGVAIKAAARSAVLLGGTMDAWMTSFNAFDFAVTANIGGESGSSRKHFTVKKVDAFAGEVTFYVLHRPDNGVQVDIVVPFQRTIMM